jgi:hypothetical protein
MKESTKYNCNALNVSKLNGKTGGGQIYGFDALKFFMATMIVAIHTKAFYDIDIIRQLTSPFLAAAVPIFFILSSYFLFRKMESKGYSWEIYKPFLRRLLILYAFWLVATLPFTLYSKWYYLDYGFPMICVYVIKDFLFSYTFAGSWFLTSLIVGTLVVFLLKKYLKVSNIVLLFLTLITYLYVKMYSFMPLALQQPYLFIQTYIRDEVELTPVVGFIWCSVGCVLAKDGIIARMSEWLGKYGCVLAFIGTYLMSVLIPTDYKFIANPFLVISIILWAFSLQLRPSDNYLKLRNLSILVYLVHFPLLSIVVHFLPENSLHIVYYLSVLFLSLMIAALILQLEEYRVFKWLKYSH